MFVIERPDWDVWFLRMAGVVAQRGDCRRRQVGAILVQDHRLCGAGYNGVPPGHQGCLQGACPRAFTDVEPGSSYDTGPGSCISTHAEANALVDPYRGPTKGATLYVTCQPCWGCMKLIRAAGIGRIVVPSPDPETPREVDL